MEGDWTDESEHPAGAWVAEGQSKPAAELTLGALVGNDPRWKAILNAIEGAEMQGLNPVQRLQAVVKNLEPVLGARVPSAPSGSRRSVCLDSRASSVAASIRTQSTR